MTTNRCSKCGAIYPNDMKECPSCGDEKSKKIKINYSKQLHSSETNLTSETDLTSCSSCGKQISNSAETCPNCGYVTGVHVCPKCKSTNTKVITGTSKAVSVVFFGIFAANKVKSNYQCNKCGHKF